MRVEGVTQSYDDWMLVVENHPDLPVLLRYANKTRRASIPVGVNSHCYYVPRREFKQFVEDMIAQDAE